MFDTYTSNAAQHAGEHNYYGLVHLFLASVVRATLRTRIIILRVLEWWWHDRQNSRAPGCRQACVFGRCFRGPVHYGADQLVRCDESAYVAL